MAADYNDIIRYNLAMEIAKKHELSIHISENSFSISDNSGYFLGTCYNIDDLYSFVSGYDIAIFSYKEDSDDENVVEEDTDKEYVVLNMDTLSIIQDNDGNANIFKTKKMAISFCRNIVSDYKIIEV